MEKLASLTGRGATRVMLSVFDGGMLVWDEGGKELSQGRVIIALDSHGHMTWSIFRVRFTVKGCVSQRTQHIDANWCILQ